MTDLQGTTINFTDDKNSQIYREVHKPYRSHVYYRGSLVSPSTDLQGTTINFSKNQS